jgi:hypothetical protein
MQKQSKNADKSVQKIAEGKMEPSLGDNIARQSPMQQNQRAHVFADNLKADAVRRLLGNPSVCDILAPRTCLQTREASSSQWQLRHFCGSDGSPHQYPLAV